MEIVKKITLGLDKSVVNGLGKLEQQSGCTTKEILSQGLLLFRWYLKTYNEGKTIYTGREIKGEIQDMESVSIPFIIRKINETREIR